jgi:hypothetical protein
MELPPVNAAPVGNMALVPFRQVPIRYRFYNTTDRNVDVIWVKPVSQTYPKTEKNNKQH